jgi:hypothetical protein
MTALFGIEARHLARSPLLWLGVALAAAGAVIELYPVWPVLAGDDLFAYRDGFVVGGGALLAGAWLALRDRATGAADLVAVTPTAPWRLWRARLASVAVVAAGAFAVVWAAGLAYSVVRGGRGMPDLRLLADGALAVVLGGWVGVAVGRLGSRVVPLLVASLWVALLFVASLTQITGLRPSVQRLSPVLSFEDRSAVFGFLPDAFWPHLGYLLGLLLLVGVALLAAAARGRVQRPPLRGVLVAALAGVVLVGASGARLVAFPDRLVVIGPAPADRVPAPFRLGGVLDPSLAYPDDDHARACARDATLSVCVYPAYGQRLARLTLRAMQPVAGLFAGLRGVPTRIRMVPMANVDSDIGACRGTEVQLAETLSRYNPPNDPTTRLAYADLYLRCALGQEIFPQEEPAAAGEAVRLWALLASGILSRQQAHLAGLVALGVISGHEGGEHPAAPAIAATQAMAELPVDQVRAELAPLWQRLRAGTLPLSELPGQQP